MSADPTEARLLAAEKRVGELEAALHSLLLYARGNDHVLKIIHDALDYSRAALANGDEAK